MRTPLIRITSDPDPIRAAQGCKVSIGHKAGRYPMVNIRRRGKSTTTSMARWLLEQKLGRRLRKGEEACHTCHSTRCINADHLKPGSHRENEAMKWQAGRGYRPTGEKNPNAKLTVAKVIEIHRAARTAKYGEKGALYRRLGQQFGLSRYTVSEVALGRRWTHVAA